MFQTGKFQFHTHRKSRPRRGPSGMDLQGRNASDFSDQVVKIVDRLGFKGCGVPTGRKNPRRLKIVKIPNYNSQDKWEPGFIISSKFFRLFIFFHQHLQMLTHWKKAQLQN